MKEGTQGQKGVQGTKGDKSDQGVQGIKDEKRDQGTQIFSGATTVMWRYLKSGNSSIYHSKNTIGALGPPR